MNPVLPTTLALPEVTPPEANNYVTRWDIFLGKLASGKTLEEAATFARVDSAMIETMRRKTPVEQQRFNDARLAGYKTTLSVLSTEHFFDRVVMGDTVEEAMIAAWGSKQVNIYRLLHADPDFAQQYRDAKAAAMHREVDEAKTIVDDTSRDVLQGPKGDIPNNAAVGRDKLRSDLRMRRAGILNRQLYGETPTSVNVTVHNYAEVLEKARARATNRGAVISKAEKAEALEATIVEVLDINTSWMDEQPKDPIWREEK